MTRAAYDELRSGLSDRIKELDLDPDTDVPLILELVDSEIGSFQARANLGLHDRPPLADAATMFTRLTSSLLGLGVLGTLLDDDDVEEIFVDGDDVYYLDGEGRLQSVTEVTSEHELLVVIDRLLRDTGRELNDRTPMVQARILDGTARLGVVARPIASRLSATLRKYRIQHETLDQLVSLDTLTPSCADLIRAAMRSGLGVLVCGRPGSGKTTLMNACLRAVPAVHRVLVCEEVRELSVSLTNGSYYQSRPKVADDGASEVSLRDLVKMCLGMRPDLLVIGEVRGAEAFELLRAGNAGCGVMATVHSNSAREALIALADTAIMAGQNVPADTVRSTLSQIFHLVVHLDREDATDDEAGSTMRQVMEVALVAGTGGDATVTPLLVRDVIGGELRATAHDVVDQPARLRRTLESMGTSISDIMTEHPMEVNR